MLSLFRPTNCTFLEIFGFCWIVWRPADMPITNNSFFSFSLLSINTQIVQEGFKECENFFSNSWVQSQFRIIDLLTAKHSLHTYVTFAKCLLWRLPFSEVAIASVVNYVFAETDMKVTNIVVEKTVSCMIYGGWQATRMKVLVHVILVLILGFFFLLQA